MFKIGKENNLKVISDPFNKNGVTAIHMHSYPKSNGLEWSSSIEFKNNKTEGKQRFNGKDFEDITIQMKLFMESL